MARLTDEEIDYVCKKIGFIKVMMKQGYEEKMISLNDVVSEYKKRQEDRSSGGKDLNAEKFENKKQD